MVTEARKHLPIQTLQNVNNTNIISDMRMCFFFKKIMLLNTFICGGSERSYILRQPAPYGCI